MKKNMGSADRSIRLIIAFLLTILLINETISGTLGIIALIVSAIFTITSLISFCPLYPILGISTCSIKSKKIDIE
jgi:hypothetical protein